MVTQEILRNIKEAGRHLVLVEVQKIYKLWPDDLVFKAPHDAPFSDQDYPLVFGKENVVTWSPKNGFELDRSSSSAFITHFNRYKG